MNANLFTKKIEMSKSEAKAAGKIGTEEFNALHQLMEMYPGYEIQIKASTKRKAEFKGLTYDYMRAYILKHDDEKGTKMAEFNALIGLEKNEYSKFEETKGYPVVKKWFLGKFPEIKQHKENYEKRVREILNAA